MKWLIIGAIALVVLGGGAGSALTLALDRGDDARESIDQALVELINSDASSDAAPSFEEQLARARIDGFNAGLAAARAERPSAAAE